MHFKMVLLKENIEYALDNTSEHDDSKIDNVTLLVDIGGLLTYNFSKHIF